METAGYKGRSRRHLPKGKRKKERKAAHFQIARFGGFDESQTICYLWDVVKSLEAVELEDEEAEKPALAKLKKQLRKRVRVEMRRYFQRQKRRNVKTAGEMVLALAFIIGLFGFFIGIDRVSGDSMYPYLNHGDWIVYSRLGGELCRGEVVVFEKNGENMVKRIAGVPGDTVKISPSGGRVVVNGVRVRENYVTLIGYLPGSEEEKEEESPGTELVLTVMDGQYMVLGDNRSVSIDSRDSGIGTVSDEEIRGKVLMMVRRSQ